MIPADFSLKCPNCKAESLFRGLASSNTFGAIWFSDMKMVAEMLPDTPSLTVCEACNKFFWIKDIQREYRDYDYISKSNSKWVRFLTFDEYLSALKIKSICNSDENERYIRIKIWWLFNDRVREKQDLFQSEEDQNTWKSNIERLIELLENTDSDNKFILADLYRNIGNFNQCLKLINSINNPEDEWIKPQYQKECGKKNTNVFKLDLKLKFVYQKKHEEDKVKIEPIDSNLEKLFSETFWNYPYDIDADFHLYE